MTLPETAREMAAAIAAGEVSPVELVERAVARIGDWQPVVNAFTDQLAEEAVAEARSREGTTGPLAGVPVAVKDLFDVAGHESTGCCAAYRGRVAGRDAELVRRLRAAGAVVVAKTNQHELAAGASGLISACGPCVNPWDPRRLAGGSSSGSGAAVASGCVPIALATDTGGSIRIPSSLCGVFGLKPTNGRLPVDGVMPMAPSLDCPGPMAGSAADLRLAWNVLSGEPLSEVGDLRRVAVLGGWFAEHATAEQLAAVEATGAVLEALGAGISRVEANGFDDVLEVWRRVAWPELFEAHGHLLDQRDLLSDRVCSFLEFGRDLPAEDRERARVRAAEFRTWFERALAGVDLLLSPTTPYPAPLVADDHVEVRPGHLVNVHKGGPAWFTEPVNLALLPALAMPAGRSSQGTPLSVQLIGAAGREDVLLATADALEAADARFRAGTAPHPGSSGAGAGLDIER